VVGYELLFRGGMENYFPGIDGDTATSRVLSGTFFTTGIDRIAAGRQAYINFPRNLVLRKIPLMFPPETTTVEVLENVNADAEVVESLREIASKGYTVALDDFSYRDGVGPLVDLCHIVKVDFVHSTPEEIRTIAGDMLSRGKRVLAEKVETHADFERAIGLGFSLFQGYFFSKPEIIKDTDIPALKMNLLRIMGEAQQSDYDVGRLKSLIEQDVGVSYKLLRYLNSPFFRRVSPITSIRQAIVMLGEKGIRAFISIILLAELGQDKPDELIKSSILRARMCELAGKKGGSRVDPSELFMMGLFSHIDAILDSDMKSVLERLPLAGEIKDALGDRTGPLAPYIELVEGYERGLWEESGRTSNELGIDEEDLPAIYMDALTYADALFDSSQ